MTSLGTPTNFFGDLAGKFWDLLEKKKKIGDHAGIFWDLLENFRDPKFPLPQRVGEGRKF